MCDVTAVKHNWETMKNAIQDYIASLNKEHHKALRDSHVNYFNALGGFVGRHMFCVRQLRKTAHIEDACYLL